MEGKGKEGGVERKGKKGSEEKGGEEKGIAGPPTFPCLPPPMTD